MIFALLLATLTMDEAVQRALRNHPEVSVARASLMVAAAENLFDIAELLIKNGADARIVAQVRLYLQFCAVLRCAGLRHEP